MIWHWDRTILQHTLNDMHVYCRLKEEWMDTKTAKKVSPFIKEQLHDLLYWDYLYPFLDKLFEKWDREWILHEKRRLEIALRKSNDIDYQKDICARISKCDLCLRILKQ